MKLTKGLVAIAALALSSLVFADTNNASSQGTTMSAAAQNQSTMSQGAMSQSMTSKVNLNTADAKTIAKAFRGIGKSRAMAIVAFRDQNGPFTSMEQLASVKGISKHFINSNRDRLQDTFTMG